MARQVETSVDIHEVVRGILKRYPVIESMESYEDVSGAIIKLNLGGFKRGETTTYSFPNVLSGLKQ